MNNAIVVPGYHTIGSQLLIEQNRLMKEISEDSRNVTYVSRMQYLQQSLIELIDILANKEP